MSELDKKKNESTYQYIRRLVKAKDDGELDLDYAELAPHVFGKEYSSDVARRMHYGLRYLIKIIDEEGLTLKPTSQMEDIKNQLGQLEVKRQEIKNKSGELKRIKKDFIKSIEISNDIKDFLFQQGMQINIPEKCFEPISDSSNKSMIVTISDFHIGYVIYNCKGNKYNLEIAKKRLNKYTEVIYQYCQLFDIKTIHVRGLGDNLEGNYLRYNQKANTEFDESQQIVEATRLIYSFLTNLTEFANVDYIGIQGNHDRFMSDKNNNVDNDSTNYVVNSMLYTFNEIAENPRLKVIPLEPTQMEIAETINGVKCKFIHGDGKIKNQKRLFDSESTMDKTMYDVIFKGHLHNFNITSQNGGGLVVGCGCLSGYNDYSAKFGCTTYASQEFAIINDGKIELIKDVNLQFN